MELSEGYINLLNRLYEGAYVVTAERRIIFWNKSAEIITGYKSSEVLNSYCHDNILDHVTEKGISLCKGLCPLHETIFDGRYRDDRVYLKHKDGYRLPVRVRCTTLKDEDNNIVAGLETFESLVNFEKFYFLNDDIIRTGQADTLTGLPIRNYVKLHFAQRLEEFNKLSCPLGVFLLDVDNMSFINSNYGYEVGDKILQIVAKTLLFACAHNDIIGRWGGDKFIGLLRNVNSYTLGRICSSISNLIRSSRFGDINITVCIGSTIARFGDTPLDIFNRAANMVLICKQEGKDRSLVDGINVSDGF